MKPASFAFLRPDSQQDILQALSEHGADASLIGGGQTLVPMLNMRLARPGLLIEATRLPELQRITEANGRLRIGCGVRQAELEHLPGLAETHPLLARAIPWIGHVQTRARGTVCGSIAHADPSAELPLCLVALGGEVHLRSRRKARSVKAEDFFLGMMSTARAPDEMIEAVSYPVATPGAGHAFAEIGRRHGDFALVAVAAIATTDGVSLTVGGIDDAPRRFDLGALDGSALEDALNDIAWSLNARDDLHATAHYRREALRRLARETITQAKAEVAPCPS
jgi:2-furoyl-CoA dehydrogenase FAD binding subunit